MYIFFNLINLDPIREEDEDLVDLLSIKKNYMNQSVWRLKNGLQEFTDRLSQVLSEQENVKLYLNEPVERITFDDEKREKSVKIKTKTIEQDFDIVISTIYSKGTKI